MNPMYFVCPASNGNMHSKTCFNARYTSVAWHNHLTLMVIQKNMEIVWMESHFDESISMQICTPMSAAPVCSPLTSLYFSPSLSRHRMPKFLFTSVQHKTCISSYIKFGFGINAKYCKTPVSILPSLLHKQPASGVKLMGISMLMQYTMKQHIESAYLHPTEYLEFHALISHPKLGHKLSEISCLYTLYICTSLIFFKQSTTFPQNLL